MLRPTVAAIKATADEFDEAGRRLTTVDPGATAFGAAGLGLLGEVGHEAYRHWHLALDARAREAVTHGRRLREFAELVDRTGGGFAEAHDAVARDQRDQDAGTP